MWLNCVSVFIGGGAGALLRYCITCICKHFFMQPILGTFIANITGCFAIGFLFALTMNKADIMPAAVKLLIITGFLGGLTTFSTFNIEVFELVKTGKIFLGASYMILSCITGLLFAYSGYLLYSKI